MNNNTPRKSAVTAEARAAAVKRAEAKHARIVTAEAAEAAALAKLFAAQEAAAAVSNRLS
jgi:hypothetical protein